MFFRTIIAVLFTSSLFLVNVILCNPVAAADKEPTKSLQLLAKAIDGKLGKDAVFAASIVEAESGNEIFSHNADKQLMPASVLKLVTSYVALKELGSDYQFKTQFYCDQLPTADSGDIGALYVRGSGDPSFVNERLAELTSELRARGVTKVERVVVDDGLFLEAPQAVGARSYEAGLSAASVNFNSLAFHVLPGKLGGRPRVEHTPVAWLDLENNLQTVSGAVSEIRAAFQTSTGGFRLTLDGTIGILSPLVTVHRSMPEPALYFGAALSAQFLRQGISVSKFAQRAVIPAKAILLTTSVSKDLALIVRDLNHYSNNFIAGQLLYTLGKDSAGLCRGEKGLEVVEANLKALGLSIDDLRLVDGSGLSRDNRVTAATIAQLLAVVSKDLSVYPDFLASLSRFGHSGTLKSRQLEVDSESRHGRFQLRDAVWGKTGTHDDVSSVAGYAESATGKRFAFCLIANGRVSKEDMVRFENSFVERMLGYRQGEASTEAKPR